MTTNRDGGSEVYRDEILGRRQHDYFPRNLGDEKGSESRSVKVMTANREGGGEVYGEVILGRRQHDPMQCYCPLCVIVILDRWQRLEGVQTVFSIPYPRRI